MNLLQIPLNGCCPTVVLLCRYEMYGISPLSSTSSPEVAPGSDATRIGRIAELRTEAKLLELGYSVARPSIDDGVDLICNGKSVQVKYGREQLVAVNKFGNGQHRFHIFASPKQSWQADVFVLWGENAQWIVPGQILRGSGVKGSVSLRVGGAGRSALFEPYRDAWHIFSKNFQDAA